MTHTIQRVVVIGSGTMGGGIAAHFANAGIPVRLLDMAPSELTADEQKKGLSLQDKRVRDRIVNASFDRMKKSKPAAFFTKETAGLVTAGNCEDNESWIAEADWIIEAIYENMDAKRALVARIDRLRKAGSIISSNTSGLPINQVACEASADFKKHFIGTHFFNPPRYMKLLEVIPTNDTDADVIKFVTEFSETRLGKAVVVCKDTPNFIANRLASVAGASLTDFAVGNGYTVEETDTIAGPLIGRPKTAAFRLQDLVGLDVAMAVGSNLYDLIPDDESREILRSPHVESLRRSQTEKGRLGDKSGQGFYKKGGKQIQSLDLQTGEYRERREPEIPSIAEAGKLRKLPERLKFVLAQDDRAGKMARHIVYGGLGYAARRVPEISDDIASIDRAVRWGFSHDLGPFETWDMLGVTETADAMESNGVSVPPWVREMVAAGHSTFYRQQNGRLEAYDPAKKAYVSVPRDPKIIVLAELKSAGRTIKENKGASLIDLGDGVLCLEFHTKMNTLDGDIRSMLVDSIDELEGKDWKGLVIGNEGADFCVGANLAGGLGAGDPASIDAAVKGMQDALMKVRYASKPVVTAPFGRTLGGGVEVAMAGARIVAASETYMGLVEVGVGLIPGAGGCKEMIRRVVSPVMRQASTDVVPFVQAVLQTIGTAKVSTSAEEARSLGFLTAADRVVMNRDHLLHEAKLEVLALNEAGYVPPVQDRNCYAGGRDVRAAMNAAIHVLKQSGFASDYDAQVSRKLAHVLTGGELSSGQWVDEQYLLDLEREAFVALCGEPKTIERIQHMLTTGKPLRN